MSVKIKIDYLCVVKNRAAAVIILDKSDIFIGNIVGNIAVLFVEIRVAAASGESQRRQSGGDQ